MSLFDDIDKAAEEAQQGATSLLDRIDIAAGAQKRVVPRPVFQEKEESFTVPDLSLGFIEQPRIVSEKSERANLLKPTSIQQRIDQANEFITAGQMREHEQQLIKTLQAKIDRGEQIDPLQMAYYQEYLDIPEPKTEMRVPEKRETLTAKGLMPSSKVAKPPTPEIDLTTGELKPIEPKPEKAEISPVEAFKEQWKTSAYQSAQSAYGALQQMGLSAISGIMDLNKKIPTPQFIKNVRNKVANAIGYDIEGVEQKAREKIDDLILDTALYRKQISDEIRKEGGMAAEIAQNIGDEFLSSAVALTGLGALKLMGNAPTIKESLKAAAKLAGITYATTEGDSLDRARSATGAGLFMLTPIPAGRMAKNWSAKLVNTALNFGVDLFTGKIGQAVTEAKNKAIEKGTPEKWKEELTTTLTPALLLESAFGLLARAKTPQQVKQVKSLYSELPPEILDSIKKVSPEIRTEWEKTVAKEELSKQPSVNAVEVNILKESGIPKKEIGDYITDQDANGAILRKHADAVNTGEESVTDAARNVANDWQNKKTQLIKESSIERRIDDAERIRTETQASSGKEELVGGAEGRLRLRNIEENRVGAELEPPPSGKVAEVAKPPILSLETAEKVAETPLERQITEEGIPRQPPAEAGGKMPFKEPILPPPTPTTKETGREPILTKPEVGAGATLSEGSKIRIGKSPQVNTILEKLPQSDIERENNEQYFRVKNDKTGAEEIVEQNDITPITLRQTGTQQIKETINLNKRLSELGLEPSVFKNKQEKQMAIKREEAKNDEKKERLLNEMPVSEELKRKPGLRNMAGAVGVEKPLRIDTSAINEAADMQRVFDKQRADVDAKLKTPLSKIRDEVSANLFGTDIPITRRLMEANGRDVVIAKVLSRGWGEKTELDLQDALADIKETIPHKLDYAFNDFLQARRTIEVSNLMREKRGVQSELFAEGELPEVILSPGGKGVKESRAWMNEFQKQHPKEFKAMEEAGKKWDNTMKGVVDDYLAEGLIDKEFHDYLVKNHPHFSPRKFLQHIDPEMSVQVQGKKVSVPDSGIQSLDVGSEKSLVNDSSFLLADVLSRKNSRIAKNRANKALYEYASENKDNPLGIRILSAEEAEKKISPELSTVAVMIDGKPKIMVGDAKLIKYWHEAPPALNQQTAQIIKTLSGTKIVKALATGYNPAFSLYNIPRDIQHYWYVATAYGGTGYSRHLPIAVAQIAKDMIKVLPDVVSRKGRYRDYINEGGGMGLLTTQGRLGRNPYGYSTIRNEALRQVEKVASWMPETSELLTRLAIREREIRSGKTPKEATYIARQVLDFSQGGKLIKTMDNVVPYLNAAMQATKGTLDAWRYSPKEALYKTAQLIVLGAISAILRKRLNEKVDDAIPDSQRVTKWNFPLPYYKIDKNGNKRYFYIPVPKEQAQQIFSTIGEELARKAMGEKVSFQRLRMAFDNLSPTDISNLPPLLAAILTYTLNKDFWMNDDVWKGREVSPSKEYYPTTPEAWKKIGEVTGLSPERLRKSAGKLIPNNPFIDLFGGMQSPIEYSKDDTIMQKIFTAISQTPAINRFMKVTPSVELTDAEIRKAEKYGINLKYQDGDAKPKHIIKQLIKEKDTETNDLRQLSDYRMDIMIGQIKNKSLNPEELQKWLISLDDDEYKRLTKRLKNKYPQGI